MAFNVRNVLISENLDPSCAAILEQGGVSVTTKVGLTADQLKDEIKGYDGLIVRSATKVTEDIIAAGSNLKIIGRAGVGVDNIDCNAATKHGVLVINAPGGNTLSAAELTCAMICSLSRSIPEACASLKNGKWDRKKFMANELMGKTLAIVGLGRIGREVAHRMQSFGMKTIGFDPLVPASESVKFGVESMELSQLWPLADYITLHVPLIPQTKDMINADVFSKCRKGVKLVNCARGGIIEEQALYSALESGQCGGVALDVYTEEPPKNTTLIQHSKVICTPHLGASTHEAQNRVADEIAQQIVALNSGESAHGIVNSSVFSLSMAKGNRPLAELNRYLGAIAALLLSNSQSDIFFTVNASGSDLHRKEAFISTGITIGMLKQRFNMDSNFINAPTLATQSGIKIENVTLGSHKEEDLSVAVYASSGGQTHSVVGTVKNGQPVLMSINGHAFKALPELSRNLIVLKSQSSPDVALKIIGSFVENAVLNNASWSTAIEGNVFCAIDTDFKLAQMPESAVNCFNASKANLDVLGQLHL